MNSAEGKKYRQTEIGVIPNDWETEILGDYCIKIGSGITPTGGEKIYKNKGRHFIRSQNVGWGQLDLSDVAFIDDEVHNTFKTTEIKADDVFLNITGASIGRSAMADERVAGGNVNQHVCIIRLEQKYLSPRFINYFLLSKPGQKQIDSFQSGGNRQGLNLGQIRKFIFPFPKSKSEQSAIATALSDTDSLITNLEKLIAKKEAVKKGTMQALLTGKKRLPGFSEKWQTKKLETIAEIQKGEMITEKEASQGFIPVIAGGVKPSYFHSKSNRPANTITISASGANAGYVAIHKYPIFASDCSTIVKDKNYNIDFLFFALKEKQIEITKLQTGGAQPHVYPEHLKRLKLNVPEEIEEQEEIAKVLIEMTNEINHLQEKLEKYKVVKQGMMQNLLTGKIRLL